jgi:hypothetical protein
MVALDEIHGNAANEFRARDLVSFAQPLFATVF